MPNLLTYLQTTELAPPLPEAAAQTLAQELTALSGLQVYPRSITAAQQSLLFLGRQGDEKYLGILGSKEYEVGSKKYGVGSKGISFAGESCLVMGEGRELSLLICPTTAANAVALRAMLPFLVAQPQGLRKSAGCGDRLGLATPGHIRAIRRSTMAPILAQQSMRENARTGRNPQQVMDEAMWGIFQEGWREGFGADADHLKTTADIDLCAAAGYTFYTIDPGEYVDNSANTASADELEPKVAALPWLALDSDPDDLLRRLANQSLDLGDFSLTLPRVDLLRAAAKYGRAVAHTAVMYRHLADVFKDLTGFKNLSGLAGDPFELEMSVDETETVTTLAEHVYIAHELKRLGVRWVSLAPRYVGEFEKGVDYKGDLAAFEQSFARHLAVAKTYGPYKLSLHSGSDKFSIYPIASRVAGELVHLKTAGTSYLEALRAIAQLNPALFRQIVIFALDRYPTDRATYHVSAEVSKVPNVSAWADTQLPQLLDDFHGREVLHVTFGSVLNHPDFRRPFFATLRGDEETYYQMLEAHFNKHLSPFG